MKSMSEFCRTARTQLHYTFHRNGSSDASDSNRKVRSIDVACALLLFKHRFRLSIACIDYLLKLLPHIPHSSVPASWTVLKSLLRNGAVSSTSKVTFICSTCSKSSTSETLCSECGVTINLSPSLKSFQNFNVSDQLHRIISSNYHQMNLGVKSTGDIMTDIRDGDVHRRLQNSCGDLFVTLSVNVDGIQPNQGTNKSIWPILLVVNEIPMQHRFSPENIILEGVWPGPKKPSRHEMGLFLKPLVEELVCLEKGAIFFIPSHGSVEPNQVVLVRVFLIGACCDKQAQALVQNIPDPIAAYSCGRCELPGTSIFRLVSPVSNMSQTPCSSSCIS